MDMPRPGWLGAQSRPGKGGRVAPAHATKHPVSAQTRASVNQRYTLGLGAASAGTHTLNPGGLGNTAAINFNDTAATVQTRLEAVIGVGNVLATGPALPGGPVTIEFTGIYAGEPVTLTGNFAGLTGATPALTSVQTGNNVAGAPGGLPAMPGPR
jgi:phage tail sheath gpL-like